MIKVIGPGEDRPKRITIPTPSLSLNHALGGGLQTGTFNIFSGNTGAGKTTISLYTAAEAQRMGFFLYFVDLENTYDDAWADACGIDKNKRTVIPPNAVEDLSEFLGPELRKDGQKSIVIVDSISAAVKRKFIEDEDSGNQVGLYSTAQKLLNDHLSFMIDVNSMVIYIAQQSTGFNQMGGFVKANVSKRVEYASSCTVKLFTSNSKENIVRDDDTKRITSQQVTWTIEKSKLNSAEGTKGSYWFNKETGEFQKRLEIIHIAKRIGLIEGTTWLTYNGQKFQGSQKLLDGLTDVDFKTMEDTIMSLASINAEVEGDS